MATIHMTKLSPRVNEEDMQRILSKYGTVTDLRMPKDGLTGLFKGMLQADFENEAQARRAADELHDHEIMGERVHVRLLPGH